MAVFKGAGVAIITPMKDNGDVNFEKLSEIIEDQINNGTDAIIICGTTGEASTLSHEEHVKTIRHCIRQVNGRVPVIAGTGSNDTATAVRTSTEAEEAGADAVLLVTPYYNKATQKGLIEHFTKIANSISIPAILYRMQYSAENDSISCKECRKYCRCERSQRQYLSGSGADASYGW